MSYSQLAWKTSLRLEARPAPFLTSMELPAAPEAGSEKPGA